MDQTFSRGPFQPKLLHDSVNTRVTKHQQVFQTLQSKYSWSQQLGIPVTDMEIYSQSRREKENWPCQRSRILASMNKSNYIMERENKSRKRGCIFHQNPLILKKERQHLNAHVHRRKKIKLHGGFYCIISFFFDVDCALLIFSFMGFGCSCNRYLVVQIPVCLEEEIPSFLQEQQHAVFLCY